MKKKKKEEKRTARFSEKRWIQTGTVSLLQDQHSHLTKSQATITSPFFHLKETSTHLHKNIIPFS